MTITSTGLGSGLDINGLVSQLMAIESQPLTQMDTKEANYQAQLAAYGQVKSALSGFQAAVTGLQSASSFQSVAANSADTSVYTASASSIAIPGNYSIEVTQLAQSQKLTSSAFATVNDVIGTGTLSFQFGTDDGMGGFTVNSAKAAQNVTIDAAHNTLSGVRDAINAANIGVSASLINDGTGYKLSLTSNDTGAANSLKITVNNDSSGTNVDNTGLSQFAYDPAGSAGNGKNLTQTVAAQNALLNVDGINGISKSSNIVTDVVQGVTLTLLKKSASGVPATLTVSSDATSVQSSVNKFVSAYNDLNKTLSGLTAYDPKTKQGAILQGDSTIASIQRQLRSMLTANVAGLNGNYKLLSDIGISFQVDGTLALDSTKLQKALASNVSDIAGIFATVGKTTDALVSYASATDNTKPGNYGISVTQLATQGYRDGVATGSLANTSGTFTSPLVIDTTNNTLALKVDGVQTSTITLTQGSYTTAAALIAELQSKINGDSALSGAGSTVSVSFDNATSTLHITSDRYGSASKVEITAVGTGSAASLGLSVGTSTAEGLDVAGTINGTVASGSGQFLTGVIGNDSEGLKVQITGGALGARGTVNYSQGYAYQIDRFIGVAIGLSGSISARTDGINKSVENINAQRDALNKRLDVIQARYLAQFNAMDTLIAQMRSTSDFLTQQLANISNLTPQSGK
jgi:flagellar hook-associated protein 2